MKEWAICETRHRQVRARETFQKRFKSNQTIKNIFTQTKNQHTKT